MKKLATIIFILFYSFNYAQVGIETTNPKAALDIKASNQATPTNTDGILIPRIDNFPATNPTADQNGMLVYLTSSESFYFWNWDSGSGTGTWDNVSSNFSMLSAKIVNSGAAYFTDNTNNWETLKFDSENFDSNSEFNVISNALVVQNAGYYQIDAQFTSTASALTNQFGIGIALNGSLIAEHSYNHSGSNLITRHISKLIFLNVGDSIKIEISDNNNSIQIDKWDGKTFLSIFRVR